MQKLIIINGFPCTGKTTIGKKLANAINYPFISRDEYKEILFDQIGVRDREWSQKLGIASYEIIYKITENLLKSNSSLIIESNFNSEYASEIFNKFKKEYNIQIIQILLSTEKNILVDRFIERAKSERHHGHQDNSNIQEIKDRIMNFDFKPLKVECKLLEFDTSNLDNNPVILDELLKRLPVFEINTNQEKSHDNYI